jgi:hypothetical protein
MKMKKYLMTGIAALALCAGFTSCSHDLDTYSPDEIKELEAQKIVNNYQKAFTATFGKVAANQTWGFGSSSFARTRAENANGNEWAASDGERWKVPPILSSTQKDVVRKYFQENRNITYNDPEWENYFIQQVYKGNPQTQGSLSPEQYESANSTENNRQYVVGSDHMDHLAAVFPDGTLDHINNFNFGDAGVYQNVLNYTHEQQWTKNENSANNHPDKIMLMVESTTNAFGYFNSDGSLGHYEEQYVGLVNWQVIDTWAQTYYPNYDGCLDDGWNRSYMGFDFEQVVGDDIYAHTNTPALNEDGETYLNHKGETQMEVRYAKISDMSPAKRWATYDGVNVFELTDEMKDSYLTYTDDEDVIHYIPMLVEQTNQYCGDNHDIDGNSIYTRLQVPNGNGGTQEDDVIDLSIFINKAIEGELPVVGSTLLKWVSVHGGADGIKSDWIVTLTKAEHYGETHNDPTTFTTRVMAEDLTADQASDFDFNDIVFDVAYTVGNNYATVTLKAAGGTLPLIIGYDEPSDDEDYTEYEVHHRFGEAVNVMINTHWNGSNGVDGKTAAPFNVDFSSSITTEDQFLAAVRDNIKIFVKKTCSDGVTKEWIELTANRGVACCKFACNKLDWCDERTNIDDVYTFSEWVQEGFGTTLAPRSQNNQ